MHKPVSNEKIDDVSTFTTMSTASISSEPVDNTGLTPSGDGYYHLGSGGGYYYCPTLYGDLYRKFTTTYDGETHSWTWGAGETLAAITTYVGLFFSGPVGIVTSILIFTSGLYLSYEQSVELETITFDYWYKVLVINGINYQANKNVTYWKSANTTTGTVTWTEKSINIPAPSCDTMIQAGIDNFLLSHSHSYSNNCDSTCNVCGYYRTISHTYSDDCDTTCNICAYIRTVNNHNYVWVLAPSGHAKKCTVCNTQIQEGSHTYSSWENNGTSGEISWCTTCRLEGANLTRLHNYNTYWLYGQPPTCNNGGVIVYDCTNCIYEYQESRPSLGHNYGNWYTTTNPTCTSAGTQRHNCQRSGCGAYETSAISALGHDWRYESYEASHPHYNYDRCSRCQATNRRSDTYSWGSYWEGWWQTSSPTCTQDGQKRRDAHCSVCYAIVGTEYGSVPATGHSWSWVTYSSSKDSSSCPYRIYWEDEKCSTCGEWHWVDRSYSSYEGHDWGSWYYSYYYFDYYTYEYVYVYYRDCSTCGSSDYMEERY